MTHPIASQWPNLAQGIAELRAVARMSSFQRALWAAEREPILRERAIAANIRARAINGWLPARDESVQPVSLINRVQRDWATLDGQIFGPRTWRRRQRASVLVEQLPLPMHSRESLLMERLPLPVKSVRIPQSRTIMRETRGDLWAT